MTQQTEKICFRYDGSPEAQQALKWVNKELRKVWRGSLYAPELKRYFYNTPIIAPDTFSSKELDESHRLVTPAEFLRLVKEDDEPKWKVGDECFYRGYRSKIIHIHDGMAWIFDIDQPSDNKTEDNIIVELHDIRPVRKSLREEVCKLIAENKGPLETVADRIIQLVKERRNEL